jgi:hypothetical protein
MNGFTDNVRKAFELYLLDRQDEAFEHLIPGSQWYEYLSILHEMKKVKAKDPQKPKVDEAMAKRIQEFEKNFSGVGDFFTLRKLFLDFDA